jgi:hypothetical protein
MSDIGPIFGSLDFAMLALIIGAPGLVLGAVVGALAWHRRRARGTLIGAGGGLLISLAGFVLWKASPSGEQSQSCIYYGNAVVSQSDAYCR